MFKVKFICEDQIWSDVYATVSNLKIDIKFYERNDFYVANIKKNNNNEEYKYIIKLEYKQREVAPMGDMEIKIEISNNKMSWIVINSSQKKPYFGFWQETTALTKKEIETILHILEKHLNK